MALVCAYGASSGVAGNSSPSSCTVSTATLQPFLSFGDQDSYFLAPGGNFEGSPGQALNGWSTTGRVAIAKNSNESYYVGSAGDSQSLFMTAGSSATTPQICVSINTPALRVFVQNNGTANSSLAVLLNYTDQNGNAQTAQIASLSGGTSWSLSPHVRFLSNIAPIVGGQGQTSVSFSFVPSGGASWQIDDLYIDPIKSQGADSQGSGSGWGMGGCC
jgi:hypothetical protein